MKTKIIFNMIIMGLIMILATGTPAVAAKDSLIVGFTGEVSNLDWYRNTERLVKYLAFLIYDPLVKRDPDDGSIHPHLVTTTDSRTEPRDGTVTP